MRRAGRPGPAWCEYLHLLMYHLGAASGVRWRGDGGRGKGMGSGARVFNFTFDCAFLEE